MSAIVVALTTVAQSATATAARERVETGVLDVAVAEGAGGDSIIATISTSEGMLAVPAGVVPPEARSGDRVAAMVGADGVSGVRVLDGRVRAQDAIPDGVRRVLVIITSTTSTVAAPSENAAEVRSVMGEVDGLFKLTSNNRVALTTDVVTASIPAATCTMSDTVAAARAASGVDTTPYQHVVVLIPQMSCGYAGIATLGSGAGSVMIVSPSFRKMVVSHEIGHNLGLEHAAASMCGTTASPVPIVPGWKDECDNLEYGDWFSPMGGSDAPSFNSVQLQFLGWLPNSQISTATSGPVTLSPLAGTTGTRSLVLDDPGGSGAYWIEYRTAVGADADLADPNQIQVRFQPKSPAVWSRVQSVLLNASGRWGGPGSGGGKNWNLDVPGMTSAGQVFTDPSGRLRVTVVSVGATATVSVSSPSTAASLAPTNLSAEFSGNGLMVTFSEPASGMRVSRYELVLSDGSGVIDTLTLRSVYTVGFDSVRPGPVTLTATAFTVVDSSGSARLDLVSPPVPTVAISSITPTAGGARVRIAVTGESPTKPTFTVTASRPGHADRVISTRHRSVSLWGLASGGTWSVAVSADFDGLTSLAAPRKVRPRKGGAEIGRVTRKSDGSGSFVLTVPRSRRGDGLARMIMTSPTMSKVASKRIPSTGRLTVRFSRTVTNVAVVLLTVELTPVEIPGRRND